MPDSRSWFMIRSTYRHLVSLLRDRSIGEQTAVGPDWVAPDLVESISLSLPGGSDAIPTIHVALRDGFPGSALPRHLALPGSMTLPLRAVRAARATAQGAPGVTRENEPRVTGTATCLVRDRLNPRPKLSAHLRPCCRAKCPGRNRRPADHRRSWASARRPARRVATCSWFRCLPHENRRRAD
jgi:hypothetical protein